MATGVLRADVGPDARVTGGDPGHVPEAPCGQPEQGTVLLGPCGGGVHQCRRHEMRDV